MKYIKRILALTVDVTSLLIFAFGFWIVFNNTLGTLINRYFSNDVAIDNLIFFLKFFFFISFIYFLGSALFKGNSLGKLLFNLKIESKNQTEVKLKELFLRELVLKWFICIAIPLLILFMGISYFFIAKLIILVLAGIYLLSLLLIKVTFVDLLSRTRVVERKNNERNLVNHLFLSLSAVIIDFSILYVICLVISFALRKYIYIQFFYIVLIVLFLYCLFSVFFKGKTIGKYYLGIEIIKLSDLNKPCLTYLKRELVLKFTMSIIIPFMIFHILGIVNPFHIFINIIVFVGFIWYVSLSYFGKSWWTILSHTGKGIKPLNRKTFVAIFLLISTLNVIAYLYLKNENNKVQDSNIKVMGFNYPFSYTEYPRLKDVEKYTKYLQIQNLTPKEYIFKLFDKYDIVIICEAFHGESTQWEMLSDVIRDRRFAENVGNVFTEYGSVAYQNKIDSFLNKTYYNDTLLEKEAACIMEYMSGGYYYFLKNCNIVNSKLPNNLKIKVHFTDILDWDYLAGYSRFFNVPNIDKRDSLMAKIVIDWHKNTGKKCLVVTNYRHAFGYAGGVDKVKNNPDFLKLTSGNEAQYIYDAFPDNTACIVQNSPNNNSKAIFFTFGEPINKGIWDKAFKLNNYREVGFDLNSSPFGNDEFDMYHLHGARTHLKYQDIFTGVIFNKPFMEMKDIGYPYQRFAAEQEYRTKYENVDSVALNEFLSSFDNKAYECNDMSWAKGIVRINFVGIFFFFLIVISSYLILVYHLILL